MSHLSSIASSLRGGGVVSCPVSSPYSPEPSRHSGLTSTSSSASSSSTALTTASHATAGTMSAVSVAAECVSSTSESGAASQTSGGVARERSPHLPEELLQLTLSFLDLPQLLVAAKVNRQWREVHESDEFWSPLYQRWYGDVMRLDCTRSWKLNFRARDEMLGHLSSSICLLAHPDRRRRVESVGFLRAHCELLKFILPNEGDPDDTTLTGRPPARIPSDMSDNTNTDANATPAVAAATVDQPNDASQSPMRSMYGSPCSPPPVLSKSRRQSLPGVHTLELRHAQHIVKDALVNRGWRFLFDLMDVDADRRRNTRTSSTTEQANQPTDTLPTQHAAAAVPNTMDGSVGGSFASTSFPFFPLTPVPNPDDEDDDDDNADSSAAASPFTSSTSIAAVAAVPSPYSHLPHSFRAIEYGAVLVAWTEYPWLRFDAVSHELDAIAQLVEARIAAETEAAATSTTSSTPLPFVARLRALHHVLYTDLGFHGNEANYYDARNSFVHCVVLHRTGIPISLAIVYMGVAMRLGLRVDGINSPGHFLLRVQDPQRKSQATNNNEKSETDATTSASASATSRRHPSADMSDVPTDAATTTTNDATDSASGASSSPSEDDSSIFFIDAFSGHMMTPAVTVDFLSLFSGGTPSTAAAAPAAPATPQLQVCSHAALFVRMYRNLMNLYQNPAYHRARVQAIPGIDAAQATALTHYEMEASLHHCASQILELMRLSGENTPDVLTSMFIERFRFAGGMS